GSGAGIRGEHCAGWSLGRWRASLRTCSRFQPYHEMCREVREEVLVEWAARRSLQVRLGPEVQQTGLLVAISHDALHPTALLAFNAAGSGVRLPSTLGLIGSDSGLGITELRYATLQPSIPVIRVLGGQ